MDLMQKIENEIERVALKKGIWFPSEENVSITMELNEEEKETFKEMDLDDKYCWWELEGNTLHITYSDNGEV